MAIEAILKLAPLCDHAELSTATIKAAWGDMLALRGWDREDVRCRLDNYRTPYR